MSTESPIETLLGPKLLDKANGPQKPTKDLLEGKDLVALYFSAAWCPPCKAFSPILKEFYKEAAKEKVEIIYVSSDNSADMFNEYFGGMPWLAIPMEAGSATIKRNLSQKLKVLGIPSLIVLDAKTGKFVTNNARSQVTSAGGDPEKVKKVVQSWKETEAVAIEEAMSAGDGSTGRMGILSMIMKSPAFIFVLIYLLKFIWGQLKQNFLTDSSTGEDL